MTPGEYSRAVRAAFRRDYRMLLPQAVLTATVLNALSQKGQEAVTVDDLLGPSPFADEQARAQREDEAERRARYERAKANVAAYSARLRAQREAEAREADLQAAPQAASPISE